MDLNIHKDRQAEIEEKGFEVKYRNNYQGNANWLTGVRIPYDNMPLKEVVELVKEAGGTD